jgi:hypothetical protein
MSKLLPTRMIKERYGVGQRTVDRWIVDETLGFPQPTMINRRRYFALDQLENWERERATIKAVAKPLAGVAAKADKGVSRLSR